MERAGWPLLYSDAIIHPSQIAASDNSFRWITSCRGAGSATTAFTIRRLCLAGENQQKKDRTPFEWFRDEKTEAEWEVYRARVETGKLLRGMKKRNYLLQNAEEVEEHFKTRNLNDTRVRRKSS